MYGGHTCSVACMEVRGQLWRIGFLSIMGSRNQTQATRLVWQVVLAAEPPHQHSHLKCSEFRMALCAGFSQYVCYSFSRVIILFFLLGFYFLFSSINSFEHLLCARQLVLNNALWNLLIQLIFIGFLVLLIIQKIQYDSLGIFFSDPCHKLRAMASRSGRTKMCIPDT